MFIAGGCKHRTPTECNVLCAGNYKHSAPLEQARAGYRHSAPLEQGSGVTNLALY
jgi:hypothetical protein